MIDLGKIAAHYGGRGSGNQCNIPTPDHSKDDLGTSLTITPGAPDGLLVTCHNGTAADALAVKDQLRRDGFLAPRSEPERNRDVASWDYTDATGATLYRKVRMALAGGGKSYRVEHPDGRGGWKHGRGGAAPVPYRLPDLASAPKDAPIYMAEGEKQADKLAELGFVATSSKDWRSFEFAGYVRGRTVLILPDNDDEGARVAEAAREAVEKAEGRPVLLTLPGLPHKGDVMDWPGTADDLRRLTDKALAGNLLPIATLDLVALAQTRAEAQRFTIERLFPAGEVSLATGPGAGGKSLLAQQLATASAAAIGQCLGLQVQACPAVYITCEDSAEQLHWRQQHICEALGVSMASLAGNLHLASLRGELDNMLTVVTENGATEPGPAYRRLAATVKATGAGLVFLDNVAHLFAGNENDRGEVTQFVNLLNRLAGETGAAIVLIGHPNKSGDSYSGSTAWLNAVRSQITLDHERDGDGAIQDADARVLTIGKANYTAKGSSLRFRWHQWAYVLEDDLPSDQRAEMDAAIRANGENAAFLRCLAAATERRKAVSENPGTNFYGSVFPRMPEGKGMQRAAFERAFERLLAIGQIELDAKLWQRENRAWKYGIRAAEKCTDRLHQPPAPTRTEPSVNTARTAPPSTTYIPGAATWPAALDDLDWTSGGIEA